MDIIEDDDDDKLQEGHYLQSIPSCDSLDKKRGQH
jgi:hypothetical protein